MVEMQFLCFNDNFAPKNLHELYMGTKNIK